MVFSYIITCVKSFVFELFYMMYAREKEGKCSMERDVLSDTNKLQLKIIDKLKQEYVGEILLMKLDAESPELGIQLLRKYHSQGIGT